MEERERIVRLWFEMWLEQKDLGIDDIFAEDEIGRASCRERV